MLASLWEPALGTGDAVALAGYEAALRSMKLADCMQDTWKWQGKKLRALLEECKALLDWAASRWSTGPCRAVATPPKKNSFSRHPLTTL